MSTCTRETFLADVAKHQMKLVRNDGLYRHLEFKGEHGRHHWFEIVTWPGVLVIHGDMETWVFSRLEDMFQFFRGDRINADYWQEKLQCARDDAKVFSEEALREQVTYHLQNHELNEEQRKEVLEALKEEVFAHGDSEHDALEALFDFSKHGVSFEPYDGPFGKEWSYHYTWCLWAIVWGIQQFYKATASEAAA